jgi:hypothetical protein
LDRDDAIAQLTVNDARAHARADQLASAAAAGSVKGGKGVRGKGLLSRSKTQDLSRASMDLDDGAGDEDNFAMVLTNRGRRDSRLGDAGGAGGTFGAFASGGGGGVLSEPFARPTGTPEVEAAGRQASL